MSTITEQNNSKIQSSIKLRPAQASLKKRKICLQNLIDKRKKIKAKIRKDRWSCSLTRVFSRDDATDLSYKLYKITEVDIDTISSCRIDNLPDRYNKCLLEKTDLAMKEKDNVMKKLKIS